MITAQKYCMHVVVCNNITEQMGSVVSSISELEIAAQGIAQCKVSATRVVADAALRRIG